MPWFSQLGFAAPWLLTALALLPVIWWLLRLTPPRPQRIVFPPTRLLLDIEKREETPSRSPWWLTLLRLLLAAAIIIAVAGPIWRPDAVVQPGRGPIWILVDNGWSAAPDWPARLATAERLIDQADTNGRPVLLAATADGAGQGFASGTADDARDRLRAIAPRPFAADRVTLSQPLETAAATAPPEAVYWLTESIDHGTGAVFANALATIAPNASILAYRDDGQPLGLASVSNDSKAMTVTVARAGATAAQSGSILALDLKGRTIGRADFNLAAGEAAAEARFGLPAELRNDIARLEIIGAENAAAVQLIDDRWRRRRVGLLSGVSSDLAQPLLSPLHYISQALGPFADIIEPRTQDIDRAVGLLIDQGTSIIVMADIGTVAGEAATRLENWVKDGGILVRFAGPRLATSADALVPVKLRTGGRILGGSLTWNEPQPLARFSKSGAFADLEVPDDVAVNRQVLAEPDADLPDKTWASLGDGTPLVTADAHGRGRLILVHVTADTTWSNLPLSGVFVEMLRRIVTLASARTGTEDATTTSGPQANLLPPLRLLDGFGRFGAPPAAAKGLRLRDIDATEASAENPPGYYGSAEGMRALNLLRPDTKLATLSLDNLAGADIRAYAQHGPVDLRPWVFSLALAILLLDGIVILILAGGLFARRIVAGIALGLVLAGSIVPHAKADDAAALDATLRTRLAYVITGNPEIDEASRLGLTGLTRFLHQRTALEPADPLGIDLATDELAFFPLIYWPIDPDADAPPARLMARVDSFMKNGGTVLFDTRDQITAFSSSVGGNASPATLRLREILRGLNIPPLEPVPGDHVLTKAFYLLQDFPGRWSGSPLWVEALPDTEQETDRPVRAGDGVSPIMITANDLVGAWAIKESGQFAYPTVPSDPHQRELAFRVGINIVMYALTGNYKADQVHIPALLERLGQ